MAHLIQMRQRIKAIETIQKITHAMRLISMSAHTRMQNKKHTIEQYKITTLDLLQTVYNTHPYWQNTILQPAEKDHPNKLVILIGSQKGLCGNFNTMLFSFFESRILKELDTDLHCIGIGKKASDFLTANKKLTLLHHYNNFSSTNIPIITAHLVNIIITAHPYFTSITVFSNVLKNFFVQQPRSTQLVPFIIDGSKKHIRETYLWEQPIEKIFSYIAHEYLYAHVYYLLFESLLAEQATRFIAMDNSTRNANQLLDDMNLMYNKLRQAKITRELTELMASF